MTTKERRPHELHDTREKILDVARDMFAHEGYESVTMRAIAERIELTPTAIYHHFKNKSALLTELCQADFQKLAQHFNASAVPADPVERILAIGEAYLYFAEKHPSQYRFMFMTVIPDPELDEDYVATTRGNPERDAYAFLREACREAIEAGRLRPEMKNPDEVAQMLWGGVHGMISLHIVKSHEGWVAWCDLRTSATQLMIAMLRGLLKNPAEAPTRP
ncbi:MAG TPA: TetR/AcrR family transcriptional regulator [Candidatus Eisenbacteria bacterium]|nr:TetR/AcrR family transcriptional regulator [Candidatus Eisenbacteria bacterium]